MRRTGPGSEARSLVHLPDADVDGPENRYDVRKLVPAEHEGRRGHGAEDGAPDLHAVGPVVPVPEDVEEGLAAGILRASVPFAFRAARRLRPVGTGRGHLVECLEDDVTRHSHLVVPADETRR